MFTLPPHSLRRIELVRDVPYTGYCNYLTNTMRWRREHEVRSGLRRLDGSLVITNMPSSPLFGEHRRWRRRAPAGLLGGQPKVRIYIQGHALASLGGVAASSVERAFSRTTSRAPSFP
jgi:hypothetical protein